MPPIRERYSRSRELPTPDHNLTGLVAPSCRQTSEGFCLRTTAVERWWLSPETRRCRCRLLTHSQSTVCGGGRVPNVGLGPAFERGTVVDDCLLLAAIDARGEDFEEDLFGIEGDLKCRLRILMKGPIRGG